MTKKKKHLNNVKPDSGFSLDKYIPEKFQTIALIGIILVIFLVYFSPMYFGDQTIQSGDIITSKSLTSYVDQERDGYTLWYPYIFGGMPAYALAVDFKWFNLIYVGIRVVRDIFSSFFAAEYAMWTFYLLLLAINSFFLINYLTKNKLIALFGGVSTSFSTGIILFLFIGHVTKLTALDFFPLIFLILLKFREKIKLRDFALLTIALQLSVQGWHVQIIFYTLFAIGIFFLFYLIRAIVIKNNDKLKQTIKSGLSFAAAFLIALIIQSDNLSQIYLYNEYSTRGSESIIDNSMGVDPKTAESEFYKYATNWSFSPEEISTFFIPSFYGSGKSKFAGELTQGREIELNTYFGQMDFVDLPMYMGILVIIFGLFSIYLNWKKPLVKYLTILIVLSLLISFGRNFSVLYDLMFYHFPFFDKFRVPSMILVLVQLAFPILASLGLKSFLDEKNSNNITLEKIIKNSAIIFSALFVFSLVFSGALQDYIGNRFASSEKGQQLIRYFNQYNFDIAQIAKSMFSSDVMAAAGILSVSFWLLLLYYKNKITSSLLLLLLTGFTLFDLIRIDNRGATYVTDQNIDQIFEQPSYIKVIKAQQNDEPYRILNIKKDGSYGSLNHNSNYNAFFLEQDMYGYSAIKPRAFQDYMDIVGPINSTLWNMLNVKYIIASQETIFPGLELIAKVEDDFIFENKRAMQRAFFVDSLMTGKPIDFMRLVGENQIFPHEVALVDEEIIIDAPDSSASVQIIEYKDENITLNVNASGNNFLFLGDTYYPHGWSAYIDGSETKIYRTNHAFRGIIVPPGKHEIQFIYAPVSFTVSKYLALIFSSLILILFATSFFFTKKKIDI